MDRQNLLVMLTQNVSNMLSQFWDYRDVTWMLFLVNLNPNFEVHSVDSQIYGTKT